MEVVGEGEPGRVAKAAQHAGAADRLPGLKGIGLRLAQLAGGDGAPEGRGQQHLDGAERGHDRALAATRSRGRWSGSWHTRRSRRDDSIGVAPVGAGRRRPPAPRSTATTRLAPRPRLPFLTASGRATLTRAASLRLVNASTRVRRIRRRAASDPGGGRSIDEGRIPEVADRRPERRGSGRHRLSDRALPQAAAREHGHHRSGGQHRPRLVVSGRAAHHRNGQRPSGHRDQRGRQDRRLLGDLHPPRAASRRPAATSCTAPATAASSRRPARSSTARRRCRCRSTAPRSAAARCWSVRSPSRGPATRPGTRGSSHERPTTAPRREAT